MVQPVFDSVYYYCKHLKVKDMKKKNLLTLVFVFLGSVAFTPLCAQESGEWSMTAGVDAVSHNLWRGMELGGPSIQPSTYFDYEKGDWAVSLGFWGTKTLFGESYSELDLSVEASWRNLTFSLSDYGYDHYFGPWQDCHDLDFGLSHTLSEDVPVTFSWYSIINRPFEGSMDGGGFDWQSAFPSYFEITYDFSVSVVDCTVSAGLWPYASDYYENDTFGICNLNVRVGHEFELKHGGSLPISAQIMHNPAWGETFWGVSVGYYFSLDL